MAEKYLYVGSYSDPKTQDGIYCYSLDEETGKLTLVSTGKDTDKPGFLAFSSDRRRLYACRENGDGAGLSAFSVSEDGTVIKLMNRIDLPGKGCCHLSVSQDDRFLVAACFFSGNVFSVELTEDGGLGNIVSIRRHHGCGPVVDWWQTAPRCHNAVFSPSGDEVAVGDLGADQVVVYRFNKESGDLEDGAVLKAHPGDGPRHCAFSADGKKLFVACEISSYLIEAEFSEDRRSFKEVDRVYLLPEGYDGPQNTVGEIYITKDQKYVFCSNRGHETICRYTIDPETGKLSDQRLWSCQGKHPRMFNFTQDEKFCVICNLETNDMSVLRYDVETGELGEVTDRVSITQPTYVGQF